MRSEKRGAELEFNAVVQQAKSAGKQAGGKAKSAADTAASKTEEAGDKAAKAGEDLMPDAQSLL